MDLFDMTNKTQINEFYKEIKKMKFLSFKTVFKFGAQCIRGMHLTNKIDSNEYYNFNFVFVKLSG